MDDNVERNLPLEPDQPIADLLADANAGDSVAQHKLVEHCRSYLMAVARSQLDPGLRTKEAVSDVVQETLVRAQQRLYRFEGTQESELFAWLRRILVNHVTDVRRKYRGSDKRDIARESGLQAAMAALDSATPGRAAIATEQIQRLRVALAGLSEDYRQVISLRNWECHSFAEIGQRMSRSTDAARMLWTRAVKQLGEVMGEDDAAESEKRDIDRSVTRVS